MKWFLLGNTILAFICLAVSFVRYVESYEDTEQSCYERLMLDSGYFFACFLISIFGLLFGWI